MPTADPQHAGTFGWDLLRVARVLAQLTQRELAQRIGMSVWRYARIEAGISPMRDGEREAIRRELPLLAQLELERESTGGHDVAPC